MARVTPARAPLPPFRLGLALFLLSTATVLFTLGLFRLLSFFIMPSLFFDLLFIGFPIGAFLGVRFFRVNLASFRRSLWILQAVMALTLPALLLCRHFDYLRAHLFEVQLGRLVTQMGTFTAFFIPFFCAYGLSEYLGYQVGRRSLASRMSLVYALYLFGAAAAYFLIEGLLPVLGIARLLLLPLLMVAVSAFSLAAPGRGRRALALEGIVLLGSIWAPWSIEERFLDLYEGRETQSTHRFEEELGYRSEFCRWGRYSLTEILSHPESAELAGFYNDIFQWEFAEPYGFTRRGLGMIPINAAARGGVIAVIGSGGGRQVRWALQPRFEFERIVAIEIEPAVFHAVREVLPERFGGVYEQPRVAPVRHEARSYMEATDETFDLIYLPSVGGYPQMMLEPGNMIRTIDAYRTMRDRLSERGLLAIWYPRGLDPREILTRQYVRTLASAEIGLDVSAWRNREEYLILARRPGGPDLPDLDAMTRFFSAPAGPDLALPPNPEAIPEPLIVLPDPEFRPIGDDQPFLAGNVRHIFSLRQVTTLFTLAAGALLVAAIGLLFGLRRRGDPGIAGRSWLSVAGLSLLIGANFLAVEHWVILSLFRTLYVFHDALVLGAIGFLIVSGLGSIVARGRWRTPCQLLAAVAVIALVSLPPSTPASATLLLLAPVAFVTGSFFPALFDASAHNPLIVFAMDAVGAALGSILSFFIPIALGFRFFFPVAGGLFIVTVLASMLFFRRLGSRLDAESGAVVASARSGV